MGVGCQSSKQGTDGTFKLNDRVEYSAAYDRELESIFNLTERGKWEEAYAEVGSSKLRSYRDAPLEGTGGCCLCLP